MKKALNQLQSSKHLFILTYFLFSLSYLAQAQPSNNDCAQATVISLSNGTCGATVFANSQSASWSGTASGSSTCIPYNGNKDIWYSFVAPVSGSIDIGDNTIDSDIFYDLYRGSCNTLTYEKCSRLNFLTASNLIPGNTYYLRVYDKNNADFNISFCLEALSAAENNYCNAATPLTLGNGNCGPSVTTTNLGLLQSIAGTPSCVSYNPYDLWYSFSAPANGKIILESLSNGTSIGYTLYSGSCSNFTEITCQTSLDDFNVFENLNSGQSYYLRLWRQYSSGLNGFEFCVREMTTAANDLCSGATPLSISTSCTQTIATSNADASDSGAAAPSCGNYNGGDLWYSFSAPGSEQVKIESASALKGRYAVYSGSCGSISEIQCGNLGNPEYINNLNSGTNYFFRVWNENNDQADISFCLSEGPTPPSNDVCNTAIPVGVGVDVCGNPASGSNIGATNSSVAAPSCTGYNGGDIWYSFNAPPSGAVSFNFNGSEWNPLISLYEGSCASLTEIDCAISSGTYERTSLNPGITYYLRIAEENNDQQGLINFCIQAITQAPSNNYCSTAIAAPVGIGSCGVTQFVDFQNATLSAQTSSCTSSSVSEDIWFSFVAPASKAIIIDILSGTSLGNIATVYEGNCNGLTEIYCEETNNNMPEVNSLTSGNTYYIQFSNRYSSSMEFCLQEGTPPPPNDLCTQAIVVPVGSGSCGTTITGSNDGATYTDLPINNCYGTQNQGRDIWYNFTAPATGSVLLDIISESWTSPQVVLYSGSCGTLIETGCAVGLRTFQDNLFTDLVSGDTYFLRFSDNYTFSNNSGNISFCLQEDSTVPPANDDCNAAATVPVGIGSCGTTVTGDNTGSNDSNEGTPSCGSFEGGDTWFSFVAPTNASVIIDIISESQTSPYLSIYKGTCGNLEEITCNLASTSVDQTITNLQSGSTYFLRWWDSGNDNFGPFSFCIQEGPAPPTNTDCASPINVSVGPTTTCGAIATGDNTFASDSGEAPPGCANNYQGGDLWYSFSAPNSGTVYFDLISANFNPYYSIYSGSCGSLTEIDCAGPIGTSSLPLIQNLTPGNTYLIRVWEDGHDNFGTFNFCLKEGPTPPANDNCSGAISIIAGSGGCGTEVSESLRYATFSNEGNQPCYTSSSNGKDLWYTFTAPNSGEIKLNISNSTWSSAYFSIYEGSCGTLTEIICQSFSSSSDPEINNLIPGNTYFLRLASYYNSATGISFCLEETSTTTSGNSLCSNADIVTVGQGICGNTAFADLNDASNSGEEIPPCGTYYGKDVWYQFTAPTSGEIDIDILESFSSIGIALYDGVCGSLNIISCDDMNAGYTGIYSTLTPGATYYLRLWNRSNSSNTIPIIEFCIKEKVSPPANDICTNAVNINLSNDNNCNNKISGTTIGATTGTMLNCGAYFGKDVYYTFTAPADDNYTIEISNQSQPVYVDIAQGSCGSLNSITCSPNGLLTFPMTGGQTYYFVVYTQDQNKVATFDICVYTATGATAGSTEAVGIGVENPQEKLQVKGGVLIGNTNGSNPGTLRFNNGRFEGHNGSNWIGLSNGGTIPPSSGGGGGADDLGNHTATQDLNLSTQKIINLSDPLNSLDAANKQYVDAHSDGDNNPANETITAINLNGNILEITEAGNTINTDLSTLGADDLGNHTATQNIDMDNSKIENLAAPTNNADAATKSYVDAHTDADDDPNNEFQTISKSSNTVTLSNGGGSFTDAVNDADSSPSNELQTISKSGNTVTLSNGGGSFTDATNDADANPANELVDRFELVGNDLELKDAGGVFTVNLAGFTSDWTLTQPGDRLVYEDGNVGILDDNPIAELAVSGKARASFNQTEAEFVEIEHDGTNGIIRTQGDGHLQIGHDLNAHLTIESNGDVGIGTTTATHKLEVIGDQKIAGDLLIEKNSSGTAPHINLHETVFDYSRLNFSNSSHTAYWTLAGRAHDTPASGTFNIYNSGTGNVMSFFGDGDVSMGGVFNAGRIGIGTSAPSDQLEIIGSGSEDLLRIRLGSSTKLRVFNNGSISLGSNNTNISTGDVYVANQLGLGVGAPSYRLTLPNSSTNSSGRALANAWQTYSDLRVKKNHAPLSYGLKEILALRPISYDHHSSSFESGALVIDSTEYSREIGFLAQDVKKVIKEIVNQPADESKALWSMDYEKLTPVLVQAIQELHAKVEALETENQTLQTLVKDVANLKAAIENIKDQQAASK